jgi:histidinol dehydrogenase
MKIIRYNQPGYETALEKLNRRAEPPAELRETVEGIIEAVRKRGDAALIKFAEQFDQVKMKPADLRVSDETLIRASNEVSDEAAEAYRVSLENVRAFAKEGLRKDWSRETRQGITVGERFQPIQRVGIYVPGGTAPLVSTSIMTVAIAAEAGVPEIAVTTPPGPNGKVNPMLLHALELSGATEIYRVGGAQAIAALALGTKTIVPVSKIFGPGNSFVTEAKRQLFGAVSIDLLAGPSEVMVLADDTANAEFIAADLLAQAEHGKDSAAVLVTPSEGLLELVRAHIRRQSQKLKRQEILREVLRKNAKLVLVPSLDDGFTLVNDYAPEHLVLQVKDVDAAMKVIRNAGCIFQGKFSPVAGGDFMAGPSHVLPTGGAGKSFGGLSADMFQNRTSFVNYSKDALKDSVETIETFSRIEGLDAHGASARVRADYLNDDD